jgi:predicted nuclease of restriction endonuclease-like (RecB) superfamily
MSATMPPAEYPAFLATLTERILNARTSAARSVNHQLVLLYWDIGRSILEKQRTAGWGNSVVERLAADLRVGFPDMGGFSTANIWRMRQFCDYYLGERFLAQVALQFRSGIMPYNKGTILAQTVREIGPAPEGTVNIDFLSQLVREMVAAVPWGHHINVLAKLNDPASRLFYLIATARFGWTRNVLLNQIKAGAYERAAKEKKSHNFSVALPEHLAEQADEMLKSSYSLEFLGLQRAVKERELEDRLVGRLRDFLLELGYGFCFIGRQHRLSLGQKEYSIDLLFYHRFLRALVAFDLKVGPFEPEHAGKMDFYLNLLNEIERAPNDQPSIGIILCAEKDDVEVEFALKTKTNPIGVAEYHLQPKLPAEFKGRLPTARQLADAVRKAKAEG